MTFALASARRGPVAGFDDSAEALAEATARLRSAGIEVLVENATADLSAGASPVTLLRGKPFQKPSCRECREGGSLIQCLSCPPEPDASPLEWLCRKLSALGPMLTVVEPSSRTPAAFEWVVIERVCRPSFVAILSTNLPHHSAWIKDRLLATGFEEVAAGAVEIWPFSPSGWIFSDVLRMRTWTLLASSPALASLA